jgi:hypothetical protein
MPSDAELWEVFALDEEIDEPQPAYGDFWEEPQTDRVEDEP